MMNEILHEVAFKDRQRSIEEAHRHVGYDAPRRSLLARWRAHRAGNAAVLTVAPAAETPVVELHSEPAASDAA